MYITLMNQRFTNFVQRQKNRQVLICFNADEVSNHQEVVHRLIVKEGQISQPVSGICVFRIHGDLEDFVGFSSVQRRLL